MVVVLKGADNLKAFECLLACLRAACWKGEKGNGLYRYQSKGCAGLGNTSTVHKKGT
jgi:hypothetical protein